MRFRDTKHEEFYLKHSEGDEYWRSFIYTVGILHDTRERLDELFDFSKKCLNLDVINRGWQTSGTMQVTRLAFNLYNDGMPTTIEYMQDGSRVIGMEQLREAQKYSVSDIFCSPLAPYFVEAVKIRFPHSF